MPENHVLDNRKCNGMIGARNSKFLFVLLDINEDKSGRQMK
jgi:hypothetical protein